jgi:hypothetical protein
MDGTYSFVLDLYDLKPLFHEISSIENGPSRVLYQLACLILGS